MKLSITEWQFENLKRDAKTLADISRVLEMDGRFKFMPSMLDSIAADIQTLFKTEAENKLDEMASSIELLEEVVSSARVHTNDPTN